MKYSDDTLNSIYDRTVGRCHLCKKRLAWKNYGRVGRKGAWEVDHSNPTAAGGTDRLSNLLPACIPCNRGKQALSTRVARRQHGLTRAPMSAGEQQEARLKNGILGAGIGTLAGLVLGAPVGLLAVLSGLVGCLLDPESGR